MVIQCDVYKSLLKDDVYLYVDQQEGLERVPDKLLQEFGEAEIALTFELTAKRSLAKEDPALVVKNINENGFHLQLPPIQYE